MAIADRIEEMYTHVGDVYDTIRNVELPEDKNIENIPRTIKDSYLEIMNNGTQQVWDNWDKVNGTGTTLTLNNTEEAPMSLVYKGNTYQDSTTGKNLYNKYGDFNYPTTAWIDATTLQSDGTIKTTANFYANSSRGIRLSLEPNTQYTVSGKLISSTGNVANDIGVVRALAYSSSWSATTNYHITSVGNFNFTFNSGNNTDWALSLNASGTVGGSYQAIYDNIQVEKGTATSYEPYTNGASPNPDYPQDIQVVSGDNTIEICGKNLFDIEQFLINSEATYTKNSDGSYTTQNYTKLYSTPYVFSDTDIPVSLSGIVDNGTATNIRVQLLDSSNNVVGEITSSSSSVLNKNACKLRINWSTAGTFTLKNIMLEKGNQATTYEPYTGESYPISLGVENLFDKDNANVFNGYWSNNTLIAQNNSYGIYISCQPNTTYTISKHVGTTFRIATTTNIPANNVSTISSTANHTGTNITITTEANAKYIWVNYYGSTDTYGQQNMLNSIEIVKGSKPSRITNNPIELLKIGTYQDKIDKSTGKNLWNEQWENGYYNRTTGAKGPGNTYIRSADYIPVEPNSTIYFNKPSEFANYAVIFYDSTKTITGTIPAPTRTLSAPIEVPSTASYFTFYGDTGVANATYKNNVIITYGTQATEYEPYGTGWYVKKEIGKVVLDGSENWDNYTTQYTGYYLAYETTKHFGHTGSMLSADKYMINNFQSQGADFGVEKQFISSSLYAIYLKISSSIVSTANDLKTWLGNNNAEVYYVLATPTYTLIEDSTLIEELESMKKSYENQTNISQVNNDMPFELDVVALEGDE